MTEAELEDIAGSLADGLRGGLGLHGGRLFVELNRLLANGRPVARNELARSLGFSRDRLDQALQGLPSVEYDGEGNVAGSGLTLNATPHRFEVDGHGLFTWCALDTLFFPGILGKTARVTSACHATGEEIRLAVAPKGVANLEPVEAVVSIVVPDAEQACCDVRGAFCNDVHFFLSREVARGWIEEHEGAHVISVPEAFEVGRTLSELVFEGVLHDGD